MISIPERILSKMRLNKNFANVYTPFHDFEDLAETIGDKKERRGEK